MPDRPTPTADKPFTVSAGLAALGIVYGDLGTSPLYTYQAIVESAGGHPSPNDLIGLLSLVVWSLIITVSVKYCVFVMRADNHGEGGILALMALATGRSRRTAGGLVAAGLFGAALIYGDGIITPAISVLSALEGVNVVTDVLKPYVMPGAMLVLVALFAAQVKGTASIGRVFGPVMLVWFITIGILGAVSIARHPTVLLAANPYEAIRFLATHGWQSFIVLGGVFLAITGGEALYADMGHIGRIPIRTSWYCIVLPGLLLCYAGQAAMLVENPAYADNPFFHLAPSWAVVPLVILATAATIIASQAIITGAFSLTRQAMQLGWFPGLNIRQTSDSEYGQIYVPVINWVMMLFTLTLTASFGSSSALAGAFGTAVSTTMLLTTALLFHTMRDVWHWRTWTALPVSGLFLAIDLAFFSSNLLKIREGGWIPLALGVCIFLVMTTWRRGVEAIQRTNAQKPEANKVFLEKFAKVTRVPGTAVFLGRAETAIPAVLVRHVQQIKSVAETVVTLSVRFEEYPRVPLTERSETEKIAEGLWHVTVRFGFVEIPNLRAALACARDQGCPIDLDNAVWFAAHDDVVRRNHRPRMRGWRRMLFAVMYRNAVRTPDRFQLPGDRFLAVGRQIAL